MEAVTYIGEHLWPSTLGHLLILTGFVSSLFAVLAYYFSVKNASDLKLKNSWLRLGNASFIIHALSIFGAIALIFYMMVNKWYEYYYVFEHVNDSLPLKYVLSAFWEGQEGSFLLWMFWHNILGLIIMSRKTTWTASVLAVLSSIQFILVSMILGIYFTLPGMEDFAKIGSSPFTLLREVRDIPLFARSDYLELIEGVGLNELLQNYWNMIHPPTLFLGFASVTIPFCYAIAGLWTGRHREWLEPCLKWALFSGAILGIGLLMGSAWAYEALSFGGYWAWDPVENTSLVPWLLLVAGIHVNLIAKSTGHSLKAAYLFYLMGFVSSVYSTLLTRSGVLGDSSAHAFTEMGLEWQLVFFLLFYIFLGAYLFIKKLKSIPEPQKEEGINTREFWMFIGALVLLMSCVLINFTTSIPVYNKIADLLSFDLNWSAPVDAEAHYNKYQVWIAIFVALLTGIAQGLRFREMSWSTYKQRFIKGLALHLTLAAMCTALVVYLVEFKFWVYILAMFSSFYAIIANVGLVFQLARRNKNSIPSILSHLGFGLLIIGILISGNKKRHISSNPFIQKDILSEMDHEKNLLLYKDAPMFMNGYWVNYTGDTLVNNERKFFLDFYKLSEDQNDTTESFQVTPNVLYDSRFNFVATNPATKRYLTHDVFTTVASLPAHIYGPEVAKEAEDSIKYLDYSLESGDSIELNDYYVQLGDIDFNPTHTNYRSKIGDFAIGADLTLIPKDKNGKFPTSTKNTILVLREGYLFHFPAHWQAEHVKLKLAEANFDRYFPVDFRIDYDTITIARGQTTHWKDYEITLDGLNTDTSTMDVELEEGSMAVGALLNFKKDGQNIKAEPIFLLRNNRVSSQRYNIPEEQLFMRFIHIDPKSNLLYFSVAKTDSPSDLQIHLADEVGRDDFIVIETIIFPGINLVWLGGVLMMVGLFLGFLFRRRRS